MIAEVIPGIGDDVVRSVLAGFVTAACGMAAGFGWLQLLWHRQKQNLDEMRQLRKETGEEREKAKQEVALAIIERRAAEHEARNIHMIADDAKSRLAETERQLEACRQSEARLRLDVENYHLDIANLREQIKELRRIIRVRVVDRHRADADAIENEIDEIDDR